MARPYGVGKKPVTVRLPTLLVGRLNSTVKAQHGSVTDFVESAIRAKLDADPESPVALPSARPDVYAKPKAQELAARFGITTAAHLEQVAKINAEFDPVFVGNCPVEDVINEIPRQDWVKLFRELQDMEPAEAEYTFRGAVAGIKLPAGFAKMPASKQVQWLQANT